MSARENSINAACNGSSNGSIQMVASGGTSSYIYSIDGIHFESSGLFENLPAGMYGITKNKQLQLFTRGDGTFGRDISKYIGYFNNDGD
jgi:hypothetical protein